MILALFLTTGLASAKTLYVNASGGADFSSIGSAISAASDGDTIIVYNGTYYETVTLDKSLVLKGVDTPVINGQNNGDVVKITFDNCSIDGFKIINSRTGVGDWAGIRVVSNNNLIANITSTDNWIGMRLESFGNNILIDNNIFSNENGGISLSSSDGNIFINNIVLDKTISLLQSSNNIFANNSVSLSSGSGFSLHGSCNNNRFIENTISSNGDEGVYAESSNNNTFIRNDIYSNIYGIELVFCTNNTIINNNISSNTGYGIYLWDIAAGLMLTDDSKHNIHRCPRSKFKYDITVSR